MSLLDSLNPRQREAVLHDKGPLLILAGAGSGKTRALVTRTAYLIAERGVPPESILAVTFTNKAASEMRERVGRLLSTHGLRGAGTPTVSTFHSFCVRLLRQYGEPLATARPGFTPRFLIFDEKDQRRVVKDAVDRSDVDIGKLKARAVVAAISRAKSAGKKRIESFRRDSPVTPALNGIFKAYQKTLRAANALDFDDLLLEAVRLLQVSKKVREAVRSRYRYLMVDEYQDTNRPQYELMRLLAEPRRNVCVVGDEDQAIYSWRGADIRNILSFEADFPAARVIRLEQNYRSTGSILRAASAVVERNQQRRGKRLWTAGAEGDLPVLYQAPDAFAEARYVARAVGQLIDGDPKLRAGILYRTNSQSRLIEEALRREGREFLVVGGVAFYQRAEVNDLLAYLKAAVAPDDPVSLRRIINVPARGIGKTTLERLATYASLRSLSLWEALEECIDCGVLPLRARKALSWFRELMTEFRGAADFEDPASALEWIYRRSGYCDMLEADGSARSEDRIENVRELLNAAREAAEDGASLHDFLDHAALVSDSDGIDEAARIMLMTIHTAKGLEFPAVAMVGMEELLLPHARSVDDKDALEEERRLCYVGMTRARRHLLLTCAAERRQYGGGDPQSMQPSRFLDEIPPALVDDRSGRSAYDRYEPGFGFDAAAARPGDLAPRSDRAERSSLGAQGVKTHDSVSAVADFFKQRAIKADLPQPPPRRGRPAPRSPGRFVPRRSRPAKPKLGRALETLRCQGPFARGTRVRHAKFGVGVVQRREGEGPTAKLSVYFKGFGMKKLVAGYANLMEV